MLVSKLYCIQGLHLYIIDSGYRMGGSMFDYSEWIWNEFILFLYWKLIVHIVV